MKILANEEIFQENGASCHASHFVRLSEHELFAVWFLGSAEGKDDVCIWGAKRTDGTWSEIRRLTADDGQPHWNPVLDRSTDGTVRLYYKAGKPIAQWHTEVLVSRDGCETWSEPKELVPCDRGGRGPVRNKILRCADGTLIAPASNENGEWTCFFDRSEDEGQTWTKSENLYLPASFPQTGKDTDPHGMIQPTLWQDGQGLLHALMRSTVGWLFRTDSEDGGKSWCPPYATEIPGNNSGIDLDRAPDGTIFLACNPVGLPEGSVWGKRTPLSILKSTDNGSTFSELTVIESGKGTFAYPALRFCDGTLEMTYTRNRKTIRYVRIELE